jgi:hypothetical protein
MNMFPIVSLYSYLCFQQRHAVQNSCTEIVVYPTLQKQNLFSIVVAVHIWDDTFQGKKIFFFCDNEASVKVINSGSSKDAFMQDYLRERTEIVVYPTLQKQNYQLFKNLK